VIRRITKEDTMCGTWSKLVRGCSHHVWIAEASKNAEMSVLRRDTVERLKGGDERSSFARAAIEKIRSRGKCFSPEPVWHGSLKKQCVRAIV
jgi:hypothetical protein